MRSSLKDTYQNPNETRPSSRGKSKSIQLFKRKSEKNISLFFGPEEHHTQHQEGFFSKSRINDLKSQGFFRGLHIYLKQNNPILLRFILIFGLPLFIIGIMVMFLAALVCIFFMGIYIMVTEVYREFGCVTATILVPGAILIGGIGATLFPWVFKRYIMQIHYEFWFQFAEEYFRELFECC